MPPNSTNITTIDPESVFNRNKQVDEVVTSNERFVERYGWMVCQSTLNMIAHFLIGMVVAINILWAFRNGLPLGPTPMHVVLCVIGYQLLMAESILSLTNENGWSSKLRFVDKRRAHWILQITGSGLAIGGSIHKILDKNVHWNTLHGQFALVAMVFTVASLFNGLTSLWAYELRRILPPNLSKITHICFGVVAFGAASICLIYGMNKGNFRNWATPALTDTFIGFVVIMTFIIIFNPMITFYMKTKQVFSK